MFENISLYTVVAITALLVCFIMFLLVKNRILYKKLEKLASEQTKELALQTSTLETIFASIPDLVFCKDLNFRFTRCNKNFAEYFGYAEKSILGKDDVEGLGLSIDVAEQFREIDRLVVRERKTITKEEFIPSIDGVLRLFETKKTPLMQNGSVVGIMGISRDITQRKTAEDTVRLTLDNLDTCIYINEIETGKILFINEKMKKEFGGGDFTGKVCWKVLQKDFEEQCSFCPIPKLIKSGDEYYVWEEHNTVTDKYYRNTDSLIKWHNGELVHMQHSVDITDSIKLQRELEQASKAKGDFLSRMSHEIRTPLNAIIGMTGIASSTEDMGKIKHCLSRMENASKHLLGIINDILDMSKIEADKFELSTHEFDFENMLMNITNIITFRVEEKHQDLVVNLKAGVPEVIIGDELRLSQVITNLLINAVKFTPENGKVVLSIEKTSDTDGSIVLKFAITDTGIGISEEQQRRLFNSFEQADGGISRKFGGTGLGLAISKRIVELMGGRIWVESELGSGSTFIFTVTVREGEKKPHEQLAGIVDKKDLRILVVDDSPETREYFAFVMAGHNLPCDAAESGAEALRMIAESGDKPYTIFFIDWQMPEMNGIELTRKIKEIIGDSAVVIMISVADWGNIQEEALAAGVKQFIPKPLFPSVLLDAINECLGLERENIGNRIRTVPDTKRRSFSGHTILIAEDVEVNREIMSAVLEETGVTVDFAENGVMAVAMFAKRPDRYRLILMDLQMPEMDGYEATRRIRALDLAQAKNIPIIAMTANVFREDIDNCLAAGMNDHMGKPIEQDVLFEKLDMYLPR